MCDPGFARDWLPGGEPIHELAESLTDRREVTANQERIDRKHNHGHVLVKTQTSHGIARDAHEFLACHNYSGNTPSFDTSGSTAAGGSAGASGSVPDDNRVNAEAGDQVGGFIAVHRTGAHRKLRFWNNLDIREAGLQCAFEQRQDAVGLPHVVRQHGNRLASKAIETGRMQARNFRCASRIEYVHQTNLMNPMARRNYRSNVTRTISTHPGW